MVALCCPQYNERPQIGEILACSGDKVQIKWYDGSWTSKWTVYTYIINRKKVYSLGGRSLYSVHYKKKCKTYPKFQVREKLKEELKKLYE